MPRQYKDFPESHQLTGAIMSPSTSRTPIHVRAVKSVGRRALTTTGPLGRLADRMHKRNVLTAKRMSGQIK